VKLWIGMRKRLRKAVVLNARRRLVAWSHLTVCEIDGLGPSQIRLLNREVEEKRKRMAECIRSRVDDFQRIAGDSKTANQERHKRRLTTAQVR
jgi:hypothetical protein